MSLPLRIDWTTALGEVSADIHQGSATFSARKAEVIDEALLAEPAGDVLLRMIKRAIPTRTVVRLALTADSLRQRLDDSLNAGVAVDPALWQRIDRVAARVQVPASSVSRERGAGGGDANI